MYSTSDLDMQEQEEKIKEARTIRATTIAAGNIADGQSRASAIEDAVRFIFEENEASADETGTADLLVTDPTSSKAHSKGQIMKISEEIYDAVADKMDEYPL